MKRVVALIALAFAGATAAQVPQASGTGAGTAAAVAPRGEPQAASELRDREFGVRSNAFGLQRRVEMYQWRRAGAGYAAAWAQEPVDSSGFDAQHANPGGFPVRTRFWIATTVLLDGTPLHEDTLKELGSWRAFRPGFSALPGNLAATFQPEGDGLSSSENPLDPQIGDLRITWHALTLPPLGGKVALQGGTWVPKQGATVAVAAQEPVVGEPAAAPGSGAGLGNRWRWGAAFAAAFGLLLLMRRRLRARSPR